MRYIDISRLKRPSGWDTKAAKALCEVRARPVNKRNAAINARARVWQEIKDALRTLSHDKCWYCESLRDRSDDAVDHFRPKGRVADCPSHPGYWWLAFDWRNYRFSCTYCNSRRADKASGVSGGKQDYFPLLDEEHRAFTEGDCLDDESPCLLDPTRPADPALLWFQYDGTAIPKHPNHVNFNRRASESIDLFNLNHERTKERRAVLYFQILHLVKSGTRYVSKYAAGDKVAEHAFSEVMRKLYEHLAPQSEFSSAARAYLWELRRDKDNDWIDALF